MPLHSVRSTPTTLHMALHGQGAAADARQAARAFLERPVDRDPPLRPVALDTALLVISELVTNAVRHTGGDCALDLHLRADGVDVDVSDCSSAEPRPRPPGHRGEGGWGWHLVNRLATEVQIRHHDGEPAGKTIHAHVPG
ncbi:ATP-binding protein [Streptomyces sp. NPDC048352]|uniref:ATP-binding protein n=1 Tax=Streptomyces sp. NPDC048352 TaxID=3154718 RepID=UPI00343A330E